MPGLGLQQIPFRIPDKWDAGWYAKHLREVLALADARNAIPGGGITITGQPNEPATISTSEDLTNLLLQSYILATPSGFLTNERVLAGEVGVIDIDDGGADSTITVGIENHGVNYGKLRQMSGMGVLGNPVDDVGEVQAINPEQDKAVLHQAGTALVFDLIDSTYVSDFQEAAEDVVGAMADDTASITFSYDDGTGSLTADIVDAYVEALVTDAIVFPLFSAVTLLTQANETADFPASRRLVAGSNVSFNVATPGQLIISSSGGGGGGGGGYPPALGYAGW
jgi:hypothetical protein